MSYENRFVAVDRSLWFAIGLHASWDWTETYFLGVANSGMPATGHLLNTSLHGPNWMTGGSAGPEASIVELVIILLVIGLLFVRFKNTRTRTFTRSAASANVEGAPGGSALP